MSSKIPKISEPCHKFELTTFKESGKYYQEIYIDVPIHFIGMYQVTDYIRNLIKQEILSPNFYYLVTSDTVSFAYPCLITLDSIRKQTVPYQEYLQDYEGSW